MQVKIKNYLKGMIIGSVALLVWTFFSMVLLPVEPNYKIPIFLGGLTAITIYIGKNYGLYPQR